MFGDSLEQDTRFFLRHGLQIYGSSKIGESARERADRFVKEFDAVNKGFFNELANTIIDTPAEPALPEQPDWDDYNERYFAWKQKNRPSSMFYKLRHKTKGRNLEDTLRSLTVNRVFGRLQRTSRQGSQSRGGSSGVSTEVYRRKGQTTDAVVYRVKSGVAPFTDPSGNSRKVYRPGRFISADLVWKYNLKALADRYDSSLGPGRSVEGMSAYISIQPFGNIDFQTDIDDKTLHGFLGNALSGPNVYKVTPWKSRKGRTVFRPFMKSFMLWWYDNKLQSVINRAR